MLRGIANIRFHTSDLEAAKRWYTEVLGAAPYFERPGYVEFRFGDYQQELGLVDRKYLTFLGGPAGAGAEPAGAVTYFQVEDVRTTEERLLTMGATRREPPRELTAGFVIAAVADPFGNLLGLMHSPHYLEVLSSKTPASTGTAG